MSDVSHPLRPSHPTNPALRSVGHVHDLNPPSTRRILTQSIEHAREAVKLDSTNKNPEEAVAEYAQSLALLSEAIRRETSQDKLLRMQSIYDTYADRMHILCLIYDLRTPDVSYSPTTYRISTPSSVETTSLYSVASSRTADTDYGIFYTRWALSQTSLDYYPDAPEKRLED